MSKSSFDQKAPLQNRGVFLYLNSSPNGFRLSASVNLKNNLHHFCDSLIKNRRLVPQLYQRASAKFKCHQIII